MLAPAHHDLAERLVTALAATVFETVELPPRAARHAPLPPRYAQGRTGDWARAFLGAANHPYLHQSLALGALEGGQNVVVSTATASGKSFIFMAAVLAELLEGDGTVLVFYPLKALGSDQANTWQRELARARLDPELVGEITGDVPMAERDDVLNRARVILATPDVINAWLMPMTTAPSARRFLGRLSLVVIDEAHSLEAVFGSQFSLFFRRLRAAHRRARIA